LALQQSKLLHAKKATIEKKELKIRSHFERDIIERGIWSGNGDCRAIYREHAWWWINLNVTHKAGRKWENVWGSWKQLARE
jgi:hypothetical protein